MFHLLRARGKQVHIINPDPMSPGYGFLRDHAPFDADRAGTPLPKVDVVVLLDCAELGRLGAMGPKVRAAGATIAVVDHHVGSEDADGSVCLVDHTAPSTGCLVYELFQEFDVEVPRPAAEGILLSLVADTGWFRYSNADARALAIATRMVECGARLSEMYDAMFRRNHPDSVVLLTEALATARIELEGRYAMACLSKGMMDRASRIGFDTDAVLEPLRSIRGVEVVGLFKERFDGSVKLSLRAKGDVNVQAIATVFGGGGHVKAAGAEVIGPPPHAQRLVLEQVRAALSAAAVDRRP